MRSLKTMAIVSEVSVGYGTPQVLSMAKSFAETFGMTATILEPDQPERPPIRGLTGDGYTITRLVTSVHPYSVPGKAEFVAAAASWINQHKPDLVLIVSFTGIPILTMLNYKPWGVIYYALEHSNGQSSPEFSLLARCQKGIDLFIFPDAKRAVLDGRRLGVEVDRTMIMLNGSSLSFKAVEPDARNGRFFYGGLLSPKHTNAHFFLDPRVRKYPLDLFGIFDGGMSAGDFEAKRDMGSGGIQYGGYLPASLSFGDVLPPYVYSLVMWAPNDEATLYAAPNKFYEAIAAGVPPISTPHPQCQRIIKKYRLGLLMEDWSFDAFHQSLQMADLAQQTDQYDEMVAACNRVNSSFLCWDRQFERLAQLITRALKENRRRLSARLLKHASV